MNNLTGKPFALTSSTEYIAEDEVEGDVLKADNVKIFETL